jgi:arylsulfatase
VPEEWADRHRGRFAAGWDVLREEMLARQKELGVVPPDAELTARHAEIPAYDDMPVELRPVLERQMEVYAGFLEHTDHHIGRLLDTLEELEIYDDTLIYLIIGDNGASAEGTINGSVNEMFIFNGAAHLETPEFLIAHVDSIGSPAAYNHYAVGWAHAMCAPYQWTKQIASHWGGTRNGTIVSWPNGFASRGEIRHQFHHVIDVAPTVLDAARLPQPDFVNGLQQMPLHGTSMTYCFDAPDAPEARQTQYFEMAGNRGIYHRGWTAVTKHRTPWIVTGDMIPFDDDVWELYDTTTDWTQSHDLAHEHPERLHHLQRLFLLEASKYGVFPLDDRAVERFDAGLAGRPTLIRGTSQKLFPGMGRLTENTVLNLKNKSHRVTAEIDVPDGGADGVIVAQGGAFAGWSLYLHEGRLTYCYNLLGLDRAKVATDERVAPGTHQVRMEFTYDGGGLGRGADVALFVDGAQAGAGRLNATVPLIFSADETMDVGLDTSSPVSDDYAPATSRFTGAIGWVQLDIGGQDDDHLITAADRWRVAMARQ